MSESEEVKVKVNEMRKGWKEEEQNRVLRDLEWRVIALERALEAVLTKIEDAEHPQAHGHDQPGWFGVTE